MNAESGRVNMPNAGRLLIVDDEVELMTVLCESLSKQGFEVRGFTTGEEALTALGNGDFDILLTDLMMPTMDGISLLRRALALNPQLVGVVMTGQGTVPTAVEAMQIGAFDYMLKPFKMRVLLPLLTRAMEVRRLRMENIQLHDTAAIHNLSQTIALTLDAKTIVEKTADAALQQYEGDEVSVLLWLSNTANNELEIAAVRGKNREALLGQRVPVQGSIAGWVAEHQEAVSLTGAVHDERFAPLYPRPDIRAAVSIPMLAGGQLLGVLNVSSLRRREFTPGEVKALNVLASTAASALANGHLYTALQESEERFRALIENSSDAIILLDAKGTIMFTSPATSHILGYPLSEIVGVNSLTLFHPVDAERAATQFRECLNEPGHLNLGEFRLRHRQGGWRWVEGTARNLLAEPSVDGVIINFHDITERKHADEIVKASEAKYKELVELASDGITVSDGQGNYLEVNSSLCAMLGYTREEFLQLNARQVVADLAENPPDYDDLRAGNHYVLEHPFIHKNGEIVPVEISARMLSSGNFQAIVRDIRQRKQAEEALRESEARFRQVWEATSDAMALSDAEGITLAANPAYFNLYGYTSDQIIGQNFTIIFREEVRTMAIEQYKALFLREALPPAFESVIRRGDGTERLVESRVVFLTTAGKRTALLSTIRDITERQQMQAALVESERAYRTLFENAPIGLYKTTANGEILDANSTMVKTFGFKDQTAFLAANIASMYVDPTSNDKFLSEIEKQGIVIGLEAEFHHQDGTTFWAEDYIRAVRDEAGNIVAYEGSLIETTERRKAAAAIQESEARFSALFRASPAAISLTTISDGRLIDVNEAFEKLFGYSPAEAIGQTALSLGLWPESERRQKVVKQLQTEGSVQGAELTFRHRSGRLVETLTSLEIVELGGQAYIIGLSQDISERKQAQEAIRASETKYRELVELASDGIAVINPQGQLIEVNTRYREMSGYTREELLQMTLREVIDSSDLEQAPLDFRPILAGETLLIERVWRRKDGALLPVEISAKRMPEGTLHAIIRDISERKKAEAALRASAELLQLVVNSAPLVITAVDTQGIFTLSEGAGLRRTGRRPGEAVGLSAFEVYKTLEIIKSDGTLILGAEAFRQGLAGEALSGMAEVNGVPFSHTFTPVRSANAQVTGVVAISIDLTDLKQADEKIRFQAHLLDTVGQAVIGTDLSGGINYWNRFAETLYGWTTAEALGRNVLEIVPSDTIQNRAVAILPQMQTGESWSGESIVHRRDGHTFQTLVNISPVREESGTLIGMVGIITDISELKQREYELQALADANARLRTTESRAEMPALILDLIMELFKAEGASLNILDAPAAEWVVELGRGNLADATGVRHPQALGLSGKVIASGELYLSDSANSDPNELSLIRVPEHFSLAGAPLVAEGNTIGVLWVGRRAVTTGAEAGLLMAIADITANAIHRATLHDETERRLSQLQALRAIDQAIKSSLDLRLTLAIVLEHIVGQLRVDAADILLLNPFTKFLEFAAGRGFRTKLPERVQVRLGEGYAGKAALERTIIQVPNLNERSDNARLMAALAAEGFASYYAVPLIAKGQVQGVLEIFHRAPLKSDDDWLEFLEALADQTAIAVDNANLFTDLQRTNTDLLLAYNATIEGWSHALDLRDKETEGHSQRVTQLTLELARAMNAFGERDFTYLRWGALLHDIGKMGIPDQILLKPGKLTDEEWEIMKRHPTYAFELLAPIAYLKPALDIPYCHHEKWDGTGYPRGLKAEQIPLAARLFAIVDVWDALRSDRPYRAAWSAAKVREHIQSLSGTHFDPQVVELFLQVVQDT
jgi:PAS domain S-box-containing protein/putative nucleotidyltransferase with HDIG domain